MAMLLEWQDALVSLPSTASCTCTEAFGKWGQGRTSASLQWEELGTVQEWLGCDEVFFLPSVLFQLVLLPHRILLHEASASTTSCPVLLLPLTLFIFHTVDWNWTPFCPSIKFLKCPSVFLWSRVCQLLLCCSCPHGGSVLQLRGQPWVLSSPRLPPPELTRSPHPCPPHLPAAILMSESVGGQR